MAEEEQFISIPFVGKSKSDENEFSLFKDKRNVALWIETEDGEASISLSKRHFEKMIEEARKLMGWKLVG